ncbi:MAG: PEP-CTERM sorting domain-containing protein [Planctomycetota bacterium]
MEIKSLTSKTLLAAGVAGLVFSATADAGIVTSSLTQAQTPALNADLPITPLDFSDSPVAFGIWTGNLADPAGFADQNIVPVGVNDTTETVAPSTFIGDPVTLTNAGGGSNLNPIAPSNGTENVPNFSITTVAGDPPILANGGFSNFFNSNVVEIVLEDIASTTDVRRLTLAVGVFGANFELGPTNSTGTAGLTLSAALENGTSSPGLTEVGPGASQVTPLLYTVDFFADNVDDTDLTITLSNFANSGVRGVSISAYEVEFVELVPEPGSLGLLGLGGLVMLYRRRAA